MTQSSQLAVNAGTWAAKWADRTWTHPRHPRSSPLPGLRLSTIEVGRAPLVFNRLILLYS